ncbi:MAG: xanthine dehydrogenase family protein subunit M [Nakamurella sp.]
MIPAAFDYVAPNSIAEALAALREGGDEAKVLAGGQSLLPVLRLRMAAPTLLVDLSKVEELRGIRQEGDKIVVGAMTTHHDVIENPLVRQHLSLLAKTTEQVADPQVRYRGTLGGALAHADPAGDLGAVTVALDAEMRISGPNGSRTVPAQEFFTDYFTTALEDDELLTAIAFDSYAGWGAHYEKFHTVSQAWSTVAVAAAVLAGGGSVMTARVALTNMGATPIRARAVERALEGGLATDEAVRAAAQAATEGTSPVDDATAPAAYRSHLAQVLTSRAVLAAVS